MFSLFKDNCALVVVFAHVLAKITSYLSSAVQR